MGIGLRNRWRIAGVLLTASLLMALAELAFAVERRLLEEVIVTAQRIEENASKVPMSVSAFTDATLKDRQIIGISDLQLNVPNMSYVPDNFGGAELTVRGIGVVIGGDDRSAAGICRRQPHGRNYGVR